MINNILGDKEKMNDKRMLVISLQFMLVVSLMISFSFTTIGNINRSGQQTETDVREIIYYTGFEEKWQENQINQYVTPSNWVIDGICSSHQQGNEQLTHYWSQMHKNFSYTHNYWTYSPFSGPFIESGEYSACIWGNDGHGEPGAQEDISDEWLITPELDFASFFDITLEFWTIYVPTQYITIPFPYTISVDNTYLIETSIDDGKTWNELADLRETRFIYGVNQFYDVYNNFDESIKLNLNSLKGKDQIRIGWHYQYPGNGTSDLWIIDNVTIKGRYDSYEPEIEITKPEKQKMYLFDKKQYSIDGTTIIVGSVQVEVDPTDTGTGTKLVKFYKDDKLMFIDEEYPFNWNWDTFGFGLHTIKTIAQDYAGNTNEDTITVFKLF